MMYRLTAVCIMLLICLQFAAADTSTLNCHAVAEIPVIDSSQPEVACELPIDALAADTAVSAQPGASMPAVAECDGAVDYYVAIEYDIDREMSTEYFPLLGTRLTFPTKSETADAIRRMARGKVTSWYHYCARTMREALGWGLGDAHQWMALPKHNYIRREPGVKARPGDILVWPFTYGSSNTQHIGMAVGTDSGVKLLSNMNGRIQLDDLEPGYVAFWHNTRLERAQNARASNPNNSS